MYKDIISYQLAENKTESDLLQAADAVLTKWMTKLPGFVSWEIHKTENGYSDIVIWENRESAQNGEQSMKNDIPTELSMQWQSCYDFSTITGSKLESIKIFKK